MKGFKELLDLTHKTFFRKRESTIHIGASQKCNRLLSNALQLHGLQGGDSAGFRESQLGGVEVYRNFVMNGSFETERAGGIVWSWWRMIDGTFLAEEGLWFSSRLLIMQVAQIMTIYFFLFLGYRWIDSVAIAADDRRAELESQGFPPSITVVYPTGRMIRQAFNPVRFGLQEVKNDCVPPLMSLLILFTTTRLWQSGCQSDASFLCFTFQGMQYSQC